MLPRLVSKISSLDAFCDVVVVVVGVVVVGIGDSRSWIKMQCCGCLCINARKCLS